MNNNITYFGCWYGMPHGPFVKHGHSTNTNGETLWGPLVCLRCGFMVPDHD